METKSIYIHIPFCDHICTYCDFSKVFYNEDFADTYIKRVADELKNIPKQGMETLYIGGGTPSSLSYDQLEYLLRKIKPYVSKKTKEFTIEVNPESVDEEKLLLMKKYGVNRLSIGVQTFQDHLLYYIGRKHHSYQAREVIEKASQLFEHVSIDMMYGLPYQQEMDLLHDLEEIQDLPINHISYYSLILEDHTILSNQSFIPIDEEADDRWTNIIYDRLNKMGFKQYEVSNYAKEGHESLHNKVYWHYDNYYGVGVGAAGKIDDQMLTHSRAFNNYLKGKDIVSIEQLSKEDTMFNHVMMSLRLVEGLDLNEFKKRYGASLEEIYPIVNKHIENGNLIVENNHVHTTPTSLKYLNSILIDFL